MTKGGLDKEGNWLEIDTIPGGRLAAAWRYLLCDRLRQRYPRDGRLRNLINQLYQKRRGLLQPALVQPKGLYRQLLP
jgi:hypothetical protein